MQISLAVIGTTVAAVGAVCFQNTLASSARLAMTSLIHAPEVIRVKKLSENAVMPVRGSEHAAGFDLASAHEATVPAGRQALIKTDLSIAIPPNTYARIAPRSGLAVKKMIDVGAGVVDFDYRGPVGVVLFNHGSEDFKVNRGDRVAQLILERISMADTEEVTELSETTRGSNGFGSTGVELKNSSEVISCVNVGYKRLKCSAVAGGAYVKYLLELVNTLEHILDETASTHKLRVSALKGHANVGNAMEGALASYEASGNRTRLTADVMIITNEICG